MRTRRGHVGVTTVAALVLATLVSVGAGSAPAGAATGDFTFFTVPASDTDGARTATDITAGPDGNLWFLARSETGTDDVLGRITPVGDITTFPLGADADGQVTAGPDGNLWAASNPATTPPRVGALSEATTSGTITPHTVDHVRSPVAITAGPRGHLWALYGNKVKEIDTDGVVQATFRLPSTGNDLTVGADGNLWVTFSAFVAGVYRLSPEGRVDTFLTDPFDGVTNPTDDLFGIAAAPDGRLWTVENDDSIPDPRSQIVLCTFTTNGTRTCDPGTPLAHVITNGPDGSLWTDGARRDLVGFDLPSRLVRLPLSGGSTEFTDDGLTDISSIAAGPDANVWFTQDPNTDGATIGRFEPEPVGAPACNASPIGYFYGDVARSARYTPALDWATCHHLVRPSAHNRFRPDSALLRGQTVDELWRFMGAPEGAPDTDFTDVPADAPYHDGLDWAVEQGLIVPNAQNTFHAEYMMKRPRLVQMLWQLVGQPTGFPAHGFTDVGPNPALDWAVANDVVSGPPAHTTFHPRYAVTRSQAVQWLYRLASSEGAWSAATPPYPPTVRFPT